jgi:hypothetical protein
LALEAVEATVMIRASFSSSLVRCLLDEGEAWAFSSFPYVKEHNLGHL